MFSHNIISILMNYLGCYTLHVTFQYITGYLISSVKDVLK